MSMKSRAGRKVSEKEIDDRVVAQADDDSAWGRAVRVRAPGAASLTIPRSLAARAAFLARLHGQSSLEWITRIVEERVELEEAAFAGARRELRLKKA